MTIATPVPRDEAERLASLYRYRILDTEPEAAFDRLTSLAAEICEAPIALVSFVDRDRQWFKSRLGLDATELFRHSAFCSHAVLDRNLLVVSDATADVRFRDNPLVVGPPHIRSYAGAPLTSPDGYTLGALCVIHEKVTHLSARQLSQLKRLAAIVVDEMELRSALWEVTDTRAQLERQARELKSALAELKLQAEGTDKLARDREQLYAEIDRSRRFVEKLIETIPVAIFARDERQRTTHANPAYASMVGLNPQQIVGRSIDEIFPPERARRIVAQDAGLYSSPSGRATYQVRIGEEGTGSHRDIVAHKAVIRGGDGSPQGVVGALLDVTEQNALREELQCQANTDPLTGAANRRAFFNRAEDEFERCARYNHPLSLIMMDLDKFKAVNDTHGHQAGDRVLRRVAGICTDQIRDSIDLFARIGGEEFAILVPEVGTDGAAALAERLRAEIAERRLPCAAEPLDLTASFGIVTVEPGSSFASIEEAIKRADDCLYASKRQGRNRVTDSSELKAVATEVPLSELLAPTGRPV